MSIRAERKRAPKWIQKIQESATKTFANFHEAVSSQPKGVATLFYNDGDIAIGVRQGGFEYHFREDFDGGRVGEPPSQESFKAMLPVNQSLAHVWEQHANGHPRLLPTLLEIVQKHRSEGLSALRSPHVTAAAKPAA